MLSHTSFLYISCAPEVNVADFLLKHCAESIYVTLLVSFFSFCLVILATDDRKS